MDKNTILAELADVGKDLVWLADPSSYKSDFRNKALAYRNDAQQCRDCYQKILSNQDPKIVLESLLDQLTTSIAKTIIAGLIAKI